MSDIKSIKLTLKKKTIAPEANPADPLVVKRIGKKVVYQVNQTPQPASITKPKRPIAPAKAPAPPKEKKGKQPTPALEETIAYRKAKAEKAITWLSERYPKLFTPNERKPLSIGIHKQIRLQNLTIPRGFIATGLTAWVQTIDYCQAVISGVGRYDLEGNLVGEITDEQRAHAQKYLEKLERQKEKRKVMKQE